MGRVVLNPGVDAAIAQRFARPRLHRILDLLQDEARARAPEARVWVTMRDERVRPSHMDADTQTIPTNLRFDLERNGFHDYARAPRDPNLPPAQRDACRCADPTLFGVIRESVHRGDVDVTGTIVSGQVETRFPRIIESHNGTSQDQAVPFMREALAEVAARLRAGQS